MEPKKKRRLTIALSLVAILVFFFRLAQTGGMVGGGYAPQPRHPDPEANAFCQKVRESIIEGYAIGEEQEEHNKQRERIRDNYNFAKDKKENIPLLFERIIAGKQAVLDWKKTIQRISVRVYRETCL